MNFIIKKREEAFTHSREHLQRCTLVWAGSSIEYKDKCYPTSLVKMYFEYYFIVTPFKYIETWTNQCDCSIKGESFTISSFLVEEFTLLDHFVYSQFIVGLYTLLDRFSYFNLVVQSTLRDTLRPSGRMFVKPVWQKP